MFCPECGKQNEREAKFCQFCGNNLQNITTQPSIQQTVVQSSPIEYAGFWRRVIATLIDSSLGFIVGTILLVIQQQILIWQEQDPFSPLAFFLYILLNIVEIVIAWLYFALMESSSKQATLGKMALGIVVTDLEGKRISFWRATGRHFSKIISALSLGIGFIIAGFTQNKQALHDMIAGTLVVKKKKKNK